MATQTRLQAAARNKLALVAALALLGVAAVELFPTETDAPAHDQKLAAARLAQQCIQAIQAARAERGPAIDHETDPSGSGLIGLAMSPVTSKAGSLKAKQTTINPNFAAVIVDMLLQAGVQEGDLVAVAYSGSFPSMNLCVSAALETMQVRPIVISSVSASQWGANLPEFMWIDMESVLAERKLLSFRSVAASLGGHEDRGLGMDEEGRKLVLAAIRRNGLEALEAPSFQENIERRMELIRRHAAGAKVTAYINVGGGTISTGASTGRAALRPGVNFPPVRVQDADGVAIRYLNQGVPVVHLERIQELALRYGLPQTPTTLPEVGEGGVYKQRQYNRWLALGSLAGILALMYLLLRRDLTSRLLDRLQSEPDPVA